MHFNVQPRLSYQVRLEAFDCNLIPKLLLFPFRFDAAWFKCEMACSKTAEFFYELLKKSKSLTSFVGDAGKQLMKFIGYIELLVFVSIFYFFLSLLIGVHYKPVNKAWQLCVDNIETNLRSGY